MKYCEAVCRHNGSHTIQVGILHQAYYTVVILSSGYTIQWAYFTGIMMGRRPRHHLWLIEPCQLGFLSHTFLPPSNLLGSTFSIMSIPTPQNKVLLFYSLHITIHPRIFIHQFCTLDLTSCTPTQWCSQIAVTRLRNHIFSTIISFSFFEPCSIWMFLVPIPKGALYVDIHNYVQSTTFWLFFSLSPTANATVTISTLDHHYHRNHYDRLHHKAH